MGQGHPPSPGLGQPARPALQAPDLGQSSRPPAPELGQHNQPAGQFGADADLGRFGGSGGEQPSGLLGRSAPGGSGYAGQGHAGPSLGGLTADQSPPGGADPAGLRAAPPTAPPPAWPPAGRDEDAPSGLPPRQQ